MIPYPYIIVCCWVFLSSVNISCCVRLRYLILAGYWESALLVYLMTMMPPENFWCLVWTKQTSGMSKVNKMNLLRKWSPKCHQQRRKPNIWRNWMSVGELYCWIAWSADIAVTGSLVTSPPQAVAIMVLFGPWPVTPATYASSGDETNCWECTGDQSVRDSLSMVV